MAAPATSNHRGEFILKIQDKTLNDGAHSIFAPDNGFLVHRYIHRSKEAQNMFNGEASLHEIKYNNFLYNSSTRKLVNECHGVFLSAVKLSEDSDEMSRSLDLKKISQTYRSILWACLMDLDDAKGSSDAEEEHVQKCKDLFTEIELVWSLLEVLLFDMKSCTLVLYRLLDWIQWHFTEPTKQAEEIANAEEPWEHANYWETVMQFVLQGNVSSARSLLKLHTSSSREDFLSMDELLRKMPMYIADSPMSWNEFQMRWHHWQDECSRRLTQGDFSAVIQLEEIAKVFCGDKDAMNAKSYLCHTWYHFLISYLLYTDPLVSAAALGAQARAFVSIMNSNTQMTELDNIILAAFELDIMELIKIYCLYFDDSWWFAAHMTDLLFRGRFISTDMLNHSYHLREILILGYAESLMCHESLWEIGIYYLDQCGKSGRECIDLYLGQLSLESENMARKVLLLAEQRRLHGLTKSICKVMTIRAINNKMYGTALSWVMKSKDVQYATILANKLVDEYWETGKFRCFEILKNLGFCMLVSENLTFLGKYCDFLKLYQEKDFRAAGSLLVSLLSSNLVPKKFQMVLLLDALPLLEAPKLVFSMAETTQLSACLQEVIENNSKEMSPALKQNERTIMLACTRNIARAFIEERSLP